MERSKRVVSECKVTYRRSGERVVAICEDVSPRGAFLRTELFLPRGEELPLEITLPSGEIAQVRSRVAHLLPHGAARSLGRAGGMGVKFEGPLPAPLAEWIEQRLRLLPSRAPEGDALRVAVVGDRPPMLERLYNTLEAAGYLPHTCATPEETFAQCLAAPPSVLLADLSVASAANWGLLRHLGAHPLIREIPVLVFALEPSDMARLEAYRLGVSDFIHEPFTDEELCIRLRRLAGPAQVVPEISALHGTLGDLGVGTLLALLEFERKSGTLLLARQDFIARVLVSDGQVRRVETPGEGKPLDKLMDVLGWTEGSFEFAPGDVDVPDEIGLPTSHLLLEHARLHDEEDKPAGDEAPAPSGAAHGGDEDFSGLFDEDAKAEDDE